MHYMLTPTATQAAGHGAVQGVDVPGGNRLGRETSQGQRRDASAEGQRSDILMHTLGCAPRVVPREEVSKTRVEAARQPPYLASSPHWKKQAVSGLS